LQENAWALVGTLLEVQQLAFSRFIANMAALDHPLGPISPLDTAAATQCATELQYRKLMEEVCWGQMDLADLLLEYLYRLLTRALCLLSMVS
jgi:hypothetical protein